MKTAKPCAAHARALRTRRESGRGWCCAEAAAASRPRAHHTDALFPGGLAGGGFSLLRALGRLARFRFRLLLKARAQRFHEIDDLGAGLGRLGQRDLLSLDLFLHCGLDSRSYFVLVRGGIELDRKSTRLNSSHLVIS